MRKVNNNELTAKSKRYRPTGFKGAQLEKMNKIRVEFFGERGRIWKDMKRKAEEMGIEITEQQLKVCFCGQTYHEHVEKVFYALLDEKKKIMSQYNEVGMV